MARGHAKSASPTAVGERIDVVDVLRGFALLGILLVNMAFFAAPMAYALVEDSPWPALHDRLAEWLIRFAAEGKFYSLFSFLFGLGMAIQMYRAEQRGARFVPLYLRRLLVLLFIGIGHATLLWFGDILVTYAMLGSVLLLFRKRKTKTLLIWCVVLLMLPTLFLGAMFGLLELAKVDAEAAAQIQKEFDEEARESNEMIAQEQAAYGSGSYGEVYRQRMRNLGSMSGILMIVVPSILAMFLLGLYAGCRGLLHDIASNLGFIRRVWVCGALIGIPGSVLYTYFTELAAPNELSRAVVLAIAVDALAAPALCFFYASSIVLLWHDGRGRVWLRPLAAPGRMALSNYLMQSLVCTTIFYSYGLRLFGRVSPAVGAGLAVLIFLAQVPLSNWWLSRFQYGPLEWIWRCLTYGRLLPLRRIVPVGATA